MPSFLARRSSVTSTLPSARCLLDRLNSLTAAPFVLVLTGVPHAKRLPSSPSSPAIRPSVQERLICDVFKCACPFHDVCGRLFAVFDPFSDASQLLPTSQPLTGAVVLWDRQDYEGYAMYALAEGKRPSCKV